MVNDPRVLKFRFPKSKRQILSDIINLCRIDLSRARRLWFVSGLNGILLLQSLDQSFSCLPQKRTSCFCICHRNHILNCCQPLCLLLVPACTLLRQLGNQRLCRCVALVFGQMTSANYICTYGCGDGITAPFFFFECMDRFITCLEPPPDCFFLCQPFQCLMICILFCDRFLEHLRICIGSGSGGREDQDTV